MSGRRRKRTIRELSTAVEPREWSGQEVREFHSRCSPDSTIERKIFNEYVSRYGWLYSEVRRRANGKPQVDLFWLIHHPSNKQQYLMLATPIYQRGFYIGFADLDTAQTVAVKNGGVVASSVYFLGDFLNGERLDGSERLEFDLKPIKY